MTKPVPQPGTADEGEEDLAPASGDYDIVRLPSGTADDVTGSIGPVRQ